MLATYGAAWAGLAEAAVSMGSASRAPGERSRISSDIGTPASPRPTVPKRWSQGRDRLTWAVTVLGAALLALPLLLGGRNGEGASSWTRAKLAGQRTRSRPCLSGRILAALRLYEVCHCRRSRDDDFAVNPART